MRRSRTCRRSPRPCPGFEMSSWLGFFAPAATPAPIVARLHDEIVKILKADAVKERLAAIGLAVVAGTPTGPGRNRPQRHRRARRADQGRQDRAAIARPAENSMSGLRIYGIARTRAFRALWMAKELGLDYEHDPVEIGDAGARTPEFLAINPNGRLPVIVDDGFVLFESLAITLYLAKKHSPGRLYPGDAGGRGEGLAVEPVGGHRGRSRRQHLVAARRPPAAGGARRGQARRGAQGSGGAVQGARRRGERSSPICSAANSPSPISTSPPSSAARSRWILSATAEPESLADPLPGAAGRARRRWRSRPQPTTRRRWT